MSSFDHDPIVVGKANWELLEVFLSSRECEDFMYMGRAGNIELYKHRWTRRYLNISSNGRRFYRLGDGGYIETSKDEAMEHVYS